MTESLEKRVHAVIRDVPDFPKPGIVFKDITPLLANSALLHEVVQAMAAPFRPRGITHVVGIESRGFLFGVPVALELGAAFVPARKPGKLPWKSVSESFALEYGRDALVMHEDALTTRAPASGVRRGTPNVLVVDDILATGGTAAAACRLVERLGGNIAGVTVLGEITGLGSEHALAGRDVRTLLQY